MPIKRSKESLTAKERMTLELSHGFTHFRLSSQWLFWIISLVQLGSEVYQMHSSRHFSHIKWSTAQQIHHVVLDVNVFTHIVPWPKIQSCYLCSSITNHLDNSTHPLKIDLTDPSLILPSFVLSYAWFIPDIVCFHILKDSHVVLFIFIYLVTSTAVFIPGQ